MYCNAKFQENRKTLCRQGNERIVKKNQYNIGGVQFQLNCSVGTGSESELVLDPHP